MNRFALENVGFYLYVSAFKYIAGGGVLLSSLDSLIEDVSDLFGSVFGFFLTT